MSASEHNEKTPPEDLALRAAPRQVARLNRKALIALATGGIAFIAGISFYALDPQLIPTLEPEELYNIDNKAMADALDSLPKSYADYQPPAPEPPPPQLGAPLPGELGKAVLQTEQAAGLPPTPPTQAVLPFESDPEAEARRAERIRLAQQAQKARESGVFFQLLNKAALNTPVVKEPASGTDDKRLAAGGDDQLESQKESKRDFLDKAPDGSIYNAHGLQDPASPYQVMAGSVIAASLITGINSDLPGRIVAQVTQAVYDTATGHHLLIPQGARLVGSYDSVIAFGQQRALVVWQRLILPDGASIVIDNFPATDKAGYAGLEDEVDFHTWRLLKGIALSTLFGVGTELTFGPQESDLVRAIRESAQQPVNQVGQKLVERNLNVQPTITVRPGWPVRVIVHKDLVLRPWGREREPS